MTARDPKKNIRLPLLLVGFTLLPWLRLFVCQTPAATEVPAPRSLIRHVAQGAPRLTS